MWGGDHKGRGVTFCVLWDVRVIAIILQFVKSAQFVGLLICGMQCGQVVIYCILERRGNNSQKCKIFTTCQMEMIGNQQKIIITCKFTIIIIEVCGREPRRHNWRVPYWVWSEPLLRNWPLRTTRWRLVFLTTDDKHSRHLNTRSPIKIAGSRLRA